MQANDILGSIREAMAALPKIEPVTFVEYDMMAPGRPWKMLDEGETFYFIHPSDLEKLPPTPPAANLFGAIPVRRFDDEMRAVFVRGLDRLAKAEEAKGG